MDRLVLLVVLLACVEEPCRGNETNEGDLEKEVAGDTVDSSSQLSRYRGRLCRHILVE